MAYDAHKNFSYSTVLTAPSPATSGTSLVVQSGDGANFPAVPFNVTIWPAGVQPTAANAEIGRVTAKSTDTFTLTRAQEGSSARTVVVGDQIAATVTAKTLTDIEAFGVVLFDSTLGSDTASIDTGAAGIAAGYNILEVWLITRTDDAGAGVGIDITVNNDTGANYDHENIAGDNATASAGASVAQAKWAINSHGSGGGASYPGVARITIPGYTQTNFFKVGELTNAVPDQTATNDHVEVRAVGWRSTAAITRMKVAAQGAAKLKTGSRMLIVGR